MTNEKTPAFESDGNFAIHVTDLDRARHFYSDVMGFSLLQDGKDKLCYETGRFRLYINKDTENLPFIPALEVDDLESARDHLMSQGCRIIRDWPHSNALYFEDPFGNKIDIIERG